MNEQVRTHGIGGTRDSAIADARRQAEQYFDTLDGVTIGAVSADVVARRLDGTVQVWGVDVTFNREDAR